MKILIAFLFLATPALAQVPKAPSQLCVDDSCAQIPPSAKYTIFDDFDSTSISSVFWNLEQDGGANTYVALSSDVALSGNRSLKSVITRDSAGDYRAELQHHAGNPAGVSFWNRDLWYGVAIYLPADFAFSARRDILVQWHNYSWLENPQEAGTSPVFGIQVNNGNWQIIRRPNVEKYSTAATQESYTTTIAPYQKGQWAKWVCRLRFHWINGQSQCWFNGKEVYNVNGGNAPNDIYPPYVLIGNYRVAFKETIGEAGVSPRTVYFDNMRAMFSDGSYEAVAP